MGPRQRSLDAAIVRRRFEPPVLVRKKTVHRFAALGLVEIYFELMMAEQM